MGRLLFRNRVLHEELRKQRFFFRFKKLPDGLPMVQFHFNPLPFFFQPGNSQAYGVVTNKRVLHPVALHGTRHIALVEHTVFRNGRFEIAQLLNRFAADNAAQQVIHVAARQLVFCIHFLRKAVVTRADRFPFAELPHVYEAERHRAELFFEPIEN